MGKSTGRPPIAGPPLLGSGAVVVSSVVVVGGGGAVVVSSVVAGGGGGGDVCVVSLHAATNVKMKTTPNKIANPLLTILLS